VRFQDLGGAAREEEADGLLAICLQHEIDQLDGIFWIQRLSKLKRDRLVARFKKNVSRARGR
jgi:peptide deformylase